jgi:hypothetical protein
MIKPAYISVICPADNDVIKNNIIYYYNLGLRDFYLMLHKPDKMLYEIVQSFLYFLPEANFKTTVNLSDEHWHDKDCKVLTDMALSDGFKWIIGSDADELLVLKQHKNIYDFIAEYDLLNSIDLRFSWFEYRVTNREIYFPENAFTEMKMREPEARQQTKSIGKFNSKMSYVPGLHYIAGSKNVKVIDPSIAYYCHFSDRNENQYVEKMKMQAVNWNKRYGKYSHWAEKMIEENPDAINKLWKLTVEGNKINNKLVNDPINERMFRI